MSAHLRGRTTARRNLGAALVLFVLACGCAAAAPPDTLTQVSVVDALLAGVYDGSLSCRELLQHGGLGIGTFDRLDGEMIVLDGTVYRARVDGSVREAPPGETTPFAAVVRFRPEIAFPLEPGTGRSRLEALTDERMGRRNALCALRVTGTFPWIRTRSVPAQTKPYPPLAAAVEHQQVLELTEVEGTLVGFRCPPFVKGINVPGYHLHFLTRDRSRGGHVLDFRVGPGLVEIDVCHAVHLILPEGTAFEHADLRGDRTEALDRVER